MQQILCNREHLQTKKTQWQIRIQGALYVKDANRYIKAHKAENIRKEWKQLEKENILGTKAPPTNTQHNVPTGNSPIQESSAAIEDVPSALFWIDSTGRR
jgi:hypothetical protein